LAKPRPSWERKRDSSSFKALGVAAMGPRWALRAEGGLEGREMFRSKNFASGEVEASGCSSVLAEPNVTVCGAAAPPAVEAGAMKGAMPHLAFHAERGSYSLSSSRLSGRLSGKYERLYHSSILALPKGPCVWPFGSR
jgi:hypothetical protein